MSRDSQRVRIGLTGLAFVFLLVLVATVFTRPSNEEPITAERIDALRRVALAGYPVGLTIAPVVPDPGWEERYGQLLDDVAVATADVPGLDLTTEVITHRFTPKSKTVLQGWYPGSPLEMDEAQRARKTTKFGSVKWVFPKEQMGEMRQTLEASLHRHLPMVRLLYWT